MNKQRPNNTAYKTLSAIQKQCFKSISGCEHDGVSLSGQFDTDRPENCPENTTSAWLFSYAFFTATGELFCKLEHKMTNARLFGWDAFGNELAQERLEKIWLEDCEFADYIVLPNDVEELLKWDRFVDQATGALLGLAVGDALGTTLEFKEKDTYEPLTDMIGGGPFHLQAGQWTDDTSMALCLAESLLAKRQQVGSDQLARYIDWARHGTNSSTSVCFDIGNTIRLALNGYLRDGNVFAETSASHFAGNGSLMRLAPISIFYSPLKGIALDVALEQAKASSVVTHSEPRAIEACQIMAWLLYQIFNGEKDKQQLLDRLLTAFTGLSPDMAEIVQGSFRTKSRAQIFGYGYVVKSLEAALWCFAHSDDFEQGALLAANLGDDADTTAEIYGQLAGAFYGYEQLPSHWLDKLFMADKIEKVAQQLACVKVHD